MFAELEKAPDSQSASQQDQSEAIRSSMRQIRKDLVSFRRRLDHWLSVNY